MDTAIMLAGMLLPISAASVFYVGDRRSHRRDQALAQQATVRIPAVELPAGTSDAQQ